jgi:tungstate transport system ATP-binding protein
MSVLAARGLIHRYGDRTVLSNVSLDIAAGEVFAVYGPNGAGKSTLLRLLSLLERPAEGEVVVNGIAPFRANLLALRREVVLVFQQPRLFSRSVLGNVMAGLRWRGLDRVEAARRAAWALERVGLGGFERRSAAKLSGGEAQLVSLARALAVRPSVLCLDEPTSDLDPRRSAQIEEIIRATNEELGTSVLLVTHNLAQGRRLARRGALLVEGRIARTGASEEVFEQSLAEFGIGE